MLKVLVCPAIEDRKINVVATTPMIGEFVTQVGGDNINLTVIMPSEADPHTYEPAPQDAGTIADADLIFYTGLKSTGRTNALLSNGANTILAGGVFAPYDGAIAIEIGRAHV